ncbi:MAG: hypothetical protein JNL57_04555 [Bacteroidetes bacterium]|nr:hypothetical protein [Bacteroidota bacterium]
MNLKNNHPSEQPVSAKTIFRGEGTVTSLQIQKDAMLKEHETKIPALLICVTGEVVFENENGLKMKMESGDSMHIEPLVKHAVVALQDSQLVLIK